MGKLREHNIKVLGNIGTGLGPGNKQKAIDIINMYKDGIINNYKQAQNMINKLSSRGKGQEKLEKTIKKVKVSKIITSIVKRDIDKPLSFTSLILNTREKIFKEIQPDIFPTVLKETEAMLQTKKSMKLNMIIFFDVYRVIQSSKDEKTKQAYAKFKVKYPSRLVIEKNNDGSTSFLEVKRSDPYSTEAKDVKQSNIKQYY